MVLILSVCLALSDFAHRALNAVNVKVLPIYERNVCIGGKHMAVGLLAELMKQKLNVLQHGVIQPCVLFKHHSLVR